MIVSTKGRYALRIMVDLAENSHGEFVPIKDVAARQTLSLKYVERIMPSLAKNGFVEGVSGKGGGYRLCREPEDYKIGEILRAAEGCEFSSAPCSAADGQCARKDVCKTRPLWTELDRLIDGFLDGISLSELL